MGHFEKLNKRLSDLEAQRIPVGDSRWCLLDCDVEAKLAEYKRIFDEPETGQPETHPESRTAGDDVHVTSYRKYFEEMEAGDESQS